MQSPMLAATSSRSRSQSPTKVRPIIPTLLMNNSLEHQSQPLSQAHHHSGSPPHHPHHFHPSHLPSSLKHTVESATALSEAKLHEHTKQRLATRDADLRSSQAHVEEARALALKASPTLQGRVMNGIDSLHPPPFHPPYPNNISSTPLASASPSSSNTSNDISRSTLRISRPILRRTTSYPASTPKSPTFSSPSVTRALSSSPPRTTQGLSNLSNTTSSRTELPSDQLQKLLQRYAPATPAIPKLNLPLHPIGTPSNYQPPPASSFYRSSTSSLAQPSLIASPSSSVSQYNLSPPADTIISLQEQLATLQQQLVRVQHDLNDHIEANTALVQEYQKLEFENTNLHECLDSRNRILAKIELNNQMLTETIETSVNAAAKDVEEEQSLRDRLRKEYEGKILVIMNENEEYTAQQLRDLEQRKHAEFDAVVKQLNEQHRKKYETVTEQTAEKLHDYHQLKQLVWSQVQTRRRNGLELAAYKAGYESIDIPTGPSLPVLLSRLIRLTDDRTSISPPLKRAHLFYAWFHEAQRLTISGKAALPTLEHKQRVLGRVVKRLAALSLWAAFRTWRAFVAHDQQADRKKKLLNRIVNRLQSLSLWHAFRGWKSFSDNEAILALHTHLNFQKKARITLLVNKWRLNGVVTCFSAWKAWATARVQRKKILLHKVLIRFVNHRLAAAWRTWQHYLDASKSAVITAQLNAEKRKRVTALIEKWRNSCQTPFFLRWRRFSQQRRQRKHELLGKCLRRMANLQLYSALHQWKHRLEQENLHVIHQQLNSQKAARVLALIQRWRLSGQAPYFLGWKAYAHTKAVRRKTLLTKIFNRFAQLQVYQSFRTWRHYVDSYAQHQLREQLTKQKTARVTALIQKWRLGSITPYFLGWRTSTRRTKARKHELLGKVIRRMEHLPQHQALRQWKFAIEQGKLNQMQSAMNAALTIEKQKRVKALIERWRRSSLGPVFISWRRFSREARTRKRELLDKILLRLAQSTLWQSWRRWTQFVEHDKIYAMQEQFRQLQDGLNHEKRKRAAAFIQAWRQRSIVPAFKEWRSYVVTFRAKKKRVLDSMIKKLGNMMLYRGWRVWKQFIDKTRSATFLQVLNSEKQKRVKALIQRWRMSSVTPCFAAWRSYTRTTRQHKRQLLEKIFRRLEKLPLHRGFRQWRQSIEHNKISALKDELTQHKRARALAAIQAWRTRSIIPTFHSWKEFTQKNRARKRALMDKILDKLAKNGLYRAFGQWKHYNESCAQSDFRAKLEEQHSHLTQQLMDQKRRRYQAMLAKWQPRNKKELFLAWRETAHKQHVRKVHLLGKVLDRLSNLQLYTAWRTWILWIDRSKISHIQSQLEGQLNSMRLKRVKDLVSKWRNRTCVPIFQAWRTWSRETRGRKRVLLDKMLRRMSNLALYGSFKKWTTFVASSEVAALRAKFARQQSGLQQELIDQKQKRVKAMIERWRLSSTTPVFQAWKTYTLVTRTRKRELLDKMLKRMANTGLYSAFKRWTSYLAMSEVTAMKAKFAQELAAQKQKRVVAIIARWRLSSLAPVFQAWRTWSRTTRERKRVLLGKSIQRLGQAELWRGFRQWQHYTDEARIREIRSKFSSEHSGLQFEHSQQLLDQKKARVKMMVESWRRRSVVPTFTAWKTFAKANRLRKRELLSQELGVDSQITLLMQTSISLLSVVCCDGCLSTDKVCRRLLHRELYLGFRTWRNWMDTAALDEMRSRLNDEKAKRVKALIEKWTRSTVIPTFQSWRKITRDARAERAAAEVQRKATLDQMLRRMVHSTKHRALRVWKHFVEQARVGDLHRLLAATRESKIAMAKQLIARWSISSQKEAFLCWRTNVRARQSQRTAALTKRQGLMDKVIRRLQHGGLYQGFRQWIQYVRQQHQQQFTEQLDEQQQQSHRLRVENESLRKKLDEQIEITTYLYKVVQNSV